MATLEELFSYRNISEAIEATSTGIPDPLPPALNSITVQFIGNETTYHTKYGQPRLVSRVAYAIPSQAVTPRKRGQTPPTRTRCSEALLLSWVNARVATGSSTCATAGAAGTAALTKR